MEKKKSMFQAFLSSIIAGIIVAMLVYFGLNFLGFKEYRATSKIATSSADNLDSDLSAEDFESTLDSKAIKERTLSNLKIDWPISRLDSKLSLNGNSGIVEISARDTNKLRAEDLADEYAELSVTVINNIYNTGASVMEYSYQNAKAIDMTLNYAAIAGGIGFAVYLIFSSISVRSHNKKLLKASEEQYDHDESKAKEQTIKNREKIEEVEKEDSSKEKYQTRPIEKINEDDFGKTKKIDSSEIISKQASDKGPTNTNKQGPTGKDKIEILGKLPNYKRGDLDV